MSGIASRLTIAAWLLVCLAGWAGAQLQIPEPPLPVDPTPLDRLLTSVDRNHLAEANNPKKLIEAYLKIADFHLQAAFTAIKSNDYRLAERELDIYSKAAAEAGKEAFGLQEGKRGAAKKVEQALYRQIKTLEQIDRLFPAEREAFPEAALKLAKQLRVHALNVALASGGGVLKDPDEVKKPESENPPTEPPPKVPPVAAAPGAEGPHKSFIFPQGFVYAVLYVRDARIRQIPGDYLTEEEDDHVREAQAADARAKVFMKIADRRMRAITGDSDSATDNKDRKKRDEEEREWGALPKLKRADLLRHYARAIAECMAKLEDAYERNPKSSALPKALAVLRDGTDRHLQALRALATDMKNDEEKAALREAIEEAEAANKGARDGLK